MNTGNLSTKRLAQRLADLTSELLENCQLKIERTAERLNLTVAEFRLLQSMRNNKVLPAGELAKRIGVSSSRLTRILDGLVAKGFVCREVGKKDRRVVDVMLTAGGEKVQAELKTIYLQSHQEIVDLLPPEAEESVIFAIEKLGDAMKEWIKQ